MKRSLSRGAGGAVRVVLALIAAEFLPQAFAASAWRSASGGTAAGSGLMFALSVLLGV